MRRVYAEGFNENVGHEGDGEQDWRYLHDGVLCNVEEYVQRAPEAHLSPKGRCSTVFQCLRAERPFNVGGRRDIQETRGEGFAMLTAGMMSLVLGRGMKAGAEKGEGG